MSGERKRLSQGQADGLAGVSNAIFAFAMLPTVLAAAILPVASTVAMLVGLALLGIVLWHFRLRWGFLWNAICFVMWLILLVLAL